MATGPLPYAPDPGTKTELTTCSLVHSETLIYSVDEALLISAYDIHHHLLAEPETLVSGFGHSRYAGPRVLIIDSGWYEKTASAPANSFIEGLHTPLKWDQRDYEQVLDQLDREAHPLAVSWDYDGSYREQIATAQSFFGARNTCASIVLLKRPGEMRFHNFDRLSGDDASNLRAFDIVGVTEKELGETVLDRLVALGRLRQLLDQADVTAPIHVFGGLDPLFTPLYFAAGAEIFDGLGWLRYSYRDGIAVSRDAGAILGRQIDKRWMQVITKVQMDNLDALRELKGELRLFAHETGDWSKLRMGETLKPIAERFEERMGRTRGR